MRKFYIFLLTFFLSGTIAQASLETIEQSMSECLKGLSDNISMVSCVSKASSDTQKEISNALPKMQNINNNQTLWKSYKNSVEIVINTPLRENLGTVNYLFAENNLYVINKNRLYVLNSINGGHYRQERYLTDSLSSCLSKSSTNLDKEKCYIKETRLCTNLINNQLKELQTLLTSKEYNAVKNNHLLWLNYKNDTEELLNNKISNLVKAQIIEMLHKEWSGMLFDIIELCKNRH